MQSAVSPALSSDGGERPQGSALAIVTSLFFMWGLLTSLNDVLIPHLKAIYTLSYLEAMLVQLCFFSAYLIVSVPAGALIRRIGYQKGVVTGLLVAAAGCALFYPASLSGYTLFLMAFFVLASGLTILQVAANPFVTVLGPARTASSRLTLTQAFNSLGTTVGPYVGGLLILSGSTVVVSQLPLAEQAAHRAREIATVQGPYLGLAAALALLALTFAAVRLPAIAQPEAADGGLRGVLRHRHLRWGAAAIFLYVGGEVSVGSFLVSFMGQDSVAGLAAASAAKYVSLYWLGAMIGRFAGFAVMRTVSPGKALAFNAGVAIALVGTAIVAHGPLAMVAILSVGLCNSIMFPTIFSMALHGLGKDSGRASGILCMAIVGGAILPFVQGLLADTVGLRVSFLVPLLCYAFILAFGLKFVNLHKSAVAA